MSLPTHKITRFYLITGAASGRPSSNFGFRSAVKKNEYPGEGRHEVWDEETIPYVLKTSFIRFFLARIFFVFYCALR